MSKITFIVTVISVLQARMECNMWYRRVFPSRTQIQQNLITKVRQAEYFHQCAKICFEGDCQAFSYEILNNECNTYSETFNISTPEVEWSNQISYYQRKFCPLNWQAFNHHCYYFGLELKSWNDAKLYCKEFGGHLVSVLDSKMQIFLQELAIQYPGSAQIAIGGYKNNAGKWFWENDNVEITYFNWGSIEPSGDGPCTSIFRNSFTWNDLPCSSKINFVCEKIN